MIGSSPIGAAPLAADGGDSSGSESGETLSFDLTGQAGRLAFTFAPPTVVDMDLTAQAPTLQLVLTKQDPNTFTFTAQPAQLEMRFGARFDLVAQPGQLEMSGDWPGIIRAQLTAELPQLEMSILSGALLRFDLLAQRPTLEMRTGATFALVAQPAQFELDILAGALMRADLVAQRPTLQMQIDQDVLLRFDLVCEPMVPAPSAQLMLVAELPRLELAFSTFVLVEYEAYAINLTKTRQGQPYEVTHYTGMPFTRIVRYRGAHYGVAATGLYLLGGDSDDGAAIPSEWLTHLADFNNTHKKTTESLYISGRLGDTAEATLVEGERAAYQYPVVNLRGEASQVYRVKFGRGIKSNFLGFGLADPEGGTMDVATLTDRTPEMSRSI